MIPFLSQKIYKRAMAKWGDAFQMEHCEEECAELIVALKHYKRGKADKYAVCEEIADVMIMAEQMAMLFGCTEVMEIKKEKLTRLYRLIENES